MRDNEKYSRIVSDAPLLEIVIKYNSLFKTCRDSLTENENKIKLVKTKLKPKQINKE